MPNDPDVLSRIFSATTGVWTLVSISIIALFKTWPLIMARLNERQRDHVTERAGDWERLRAEVSRLADRVEALERKVDECEAERDEAMRRAIRAETELIRVNAYHQGTGEAREVAQLIVSAEREGIKP